MNQVWLALLTGLTTGGLSCFAVQGGLLTSSVVEKDNLSPKIKVSLFLVAKIIAYTILGALLGYFGSALTISSKTQGVLQIFAGLVMFITVGRLLDLHPIFRKFVITPPKFIYRFVRNQSKIGQGFAPFLLGFLTLLIPCGVTQAVMLLSIASGSPLMGSLILGAFTIGTSPVFFGLGIASAKIFESPKLKYVAALVIFILGVISINTGQVLRGSPQTLQNFAKVIFPTKKVAQEKVPAPVDSNGKQIAEISVTSRGYSSNVETLKVGVPTKIILNTKNTQSCARAFTIPDYNIMKILPETGQEIVEITPTKTGKLNFTCSMGMYSGFFQVI